MTVRNASHHVLGSLVVEGFELNSVGFGLGLGEGRELSQPLWGRWAELVTINDQLSVRRPFAISQTLLWVEDRADAVVQERLKAGFALEVVAGVEHGRLVSVASNEEVANTGPPWTLGASAVRDVCIV